MELLGLSGLTGQLRRSEPALKAAQGRGPQVSRAGVGGVQV